MHHWSGNEYSSALRLNLKRHTGSTIHLMSPFFFHLQEKIYFKIHPHCLLSVIWWSWNTPNSAPFLLPHTESLILKILTALRSFSHQWSYPTLLGSVNVVSDAGRSYRTQTSGSTFLLPSSIFCRRITEFRLKWIERIYWFGCYVFWKELFAHWMLSPSALNSS